MKKVLVSAGVAAIALMALAGGKNDPVLMTVNGRDVHKSEFEYLYHKNNSQQMQPQTIDEYVKMFVDYKLKVADAEAARLDTTEQFRKEFNSFCADLAQPYMIDSVVLDELVRDAYTHTLKNRKVSHIMLSPAQDAAGNDSVAEYLAGIRRQLLDGTLDWNETAARMSVDRYSAPNGGTMGWLTPGRLPWPFEKAAYDTPVGEISDVVNSGFGFHIVRVEDERPAPGEVRARHILKLTARKTPEQAAAAKAQIDSIYNVLLSGADFATVARAESEDPGSATNGGELGWFGPGAMVAEFDSAVFALADGAISTPVKTSFGYHIIQREESRKPLDLEAMRPQLVSQINGDERGTIPYNSRLKQLFAKHKARILSDGLDKVRDLVDRNGGYDSLAIAKLRKSDIAVFELNGKKTPVSAVMELLPITASTSSENARVIIADAAERMLSSKVVEAERESMLSENPEYSNLVNEYRDGILLFDISNRNVWDKATKDKEGLEKFFDANRDKYKWNAPRFKGYIVFAPGDSVLALAKEYCDSVDRAGFDADTFVPDIRKRFGRDIKVERVIAAKGDNAITDYLAFGGTRPEQDKKTRWTAYFPFRGHIADQPEEAIDVRGEVTTDYQNLLEKQWLEELHRKYKVKINDKVLRTVK